MTTFRAPESTWEAGNAGLHPAKRKRASTAKPQTKAVLAEKKLLKMIERDYSI
jgi:hypothetical protein